MLTGAGNRRLAVQGCAHGPSRWQDDWGTLAFEEGFLRGKQTGMYASLNVGYQKGNQIRESFIVRERKKQKKNG